MVRVITFAVVSANVINFVGNWLLMYGNWGAPRMGLEGSGYSTSLSRFYIGLVLGIAVLRHERLHGNAIFRMDWRPHWSRLRALLSLGAPAAVQIGVEGLVFSVVSVMAAKLDALSLAAHTVGINVISITYMVPLGISSAAAVRVGQAVGRRDPRGAAAAGWTAMALSGVFMAIAGLAMLAAPNRICSTTSRAFGASSAWPK